MDYELGLGKLKAYAQDTDWLLEFTTYEARLRENLQEERLFGSSPQNNASRNAIIAQLNRLAIRTLDFSFNELCMQATPAFSNTPPSTSTPGQQTNHQGKPFNIFISYHEKDLRYLQELQTHLNQYVKKGTLQYWDNTKMLPGTRKDAETARALHNANAAILLVSADYLSPNEHLTRELPTLLLEEQHEGKKILCVIVRPCAFKDSELAQFTPVNKPEHALSTMKMSAREEVWANLATLIKDLLE